MLAILFPHISPIIFQVGFIKIHWYAVAYLVGIVFGYLLLKKLNSSGRKVLSDVALDDIIMYAVLGIVLGGRLGYVFFYDFENFLDDPKRIFFIWKGGMSFHGGTLGLIISMFLLSKKHKFNFLQLMDMICVVAPIGLFFGRLANFINSELWGRTTDVAWAVVFPNGGDLPRHPSQIYEAILEGIVLFVIMLCCFRNKKIISAPGKLAGIFLVGYSFARIFIEFYREPDYQIGYLLEYFTMGQLLTLPMLAAGAYLILKNKFHPQKSLPHRQRF
ncbi:MAG: prolipoprotein diacylglyceryl transferase [Rickettsiales bacterium]